MGEIECVYCIYFGPRKETFDFIWWKKTYAGMFPPTY